jgi:hypothetical protein
MAVTKTKGRPIALKDPYGALARAMGGLGTLSTALGVSARTIRDWSNGRSRPEGPALILLNLILTQHHLDPIR